MPRYLAVVHRDPREDVFVMRSPDFPDVEQRCEQFAELPEVAKQAIQEQLSKLAAEGKQPPPPTSEESLQASGEYRSCFLIPVEVQ